MNKELSRRQFLTAATALAVTGTQQIRVLGASTQEDLSARLPETIRVGIIGLDGHYSEITNAAKLVPNIRVTAIADPNPAALQRAAADPMLAKATAWARAARSPASRIVRMSPAFTWAWPAATTVPTIERTIWWQKAFASISKRSRPSPRAPPWDAGRRR